MVIFYIYFTNNNYFYKNNYYINKIIKMILK